MSLFVSNNSPVKCNLTLSAGDWIGYDDKVVKLFIDKNLCIFKSKYYY